MHKVWEVNIHLFGGKPSTIDQNLLIRDHVIYTFGKWMLCLMLWITHIMKKYTKNNIATCFIVNKFAYYNLFKLYINQTLMLNKTKW